MNNWWTGVPDDPNPNFPPWWTDFLFFISGVCLGAVLILVFVK